MVDIGRALGVSAVTVSNALSNQKGVSEELREKIIAKAKEMGYVSAAQKTQQTESALSVGVVIHEGYLDKYATFYWDEYQRLSINAVEHNCVTIVEILKERDISERTIPLIVKENKIQALIIMGEISTEYIENLKANIDMPMVFLDFYKRTITDVDCVISNNFYGMYLLTNEVIRRGHRDLMYVGTVNSVASITDRFYGFAKSLSENGIELTKDMVINDREIGSTYVNIELPEHMPSAFVCNCDLVAAMVADKLQEQGYRIPEDVSVVGFDNYLYRGLSNIKFTTYDVNVDRATHTALQAITDMLSGKKTEGGEVHIISGKLIMRDSLRTIE